MSAATVGLPLGGFVVGGLLGDTFRKPHSTSMLPALVGGLLVGGAALALVVFGHEHVQLVAGDRYRVTSPFPSDADKPTVFAGLAEIGAIVTVLGPDVLVYELTAQNTKTLALGVDAFDFAEPLTGRDVKLRVDRVEEIPA